MKKVTSNKVSDGRIYIRSDPMTQDGANEKLEISTSLIREKKNRAPADE